MNYNIENQQSTSGKGDQRESDYVIPVQPRNSRIKILEKYTIRNQIMIMIWSVSTFAIITKMFRGLCRTVAEKKSITINIGRKR